MRDPSGATAAGDVSTCPSKSSNAAFSGGEIYDLTISAVVVGRVKYPTITPATSATAAIAPAIQPHLVVLRTGAFVWEVESVIHMSCSLRSCAVCTRSSGSFARQALTKRSNAGVESGCNADIGCGSPARIAAMVLAVVLPSNA